MRAISLPLLRNARSGPPVPRRQHARDAHGRDASGCGGDPPVIDAEFVTLEPETPAPAALPPPDRPAPDLPAFRRACAAYRWAATLDGAAGHEVEV